MKIQCQCGNSKTANLNGREIPNKAKLLRCNFCPKCENDSHEDYYEEWFEDSKGNLVGEKHQPIF